MISFDLRFNNLRSAFFKLFLALSLIIFSFPVEAQDFITGYAGSAYNLSGKQVVHVTNLNDSGPGSFRDAISQPNRVVLFDVGGIINLNSRLSIQEDNIVVAGFTAPGQYGIILKGGQGLQVKNASNVAVIGVKVWIDAFSTQSIDAVQTSSANNVLIAYGSALFGTDECLSTYAGGTTTSIQSSNITFFKMLAVGSASDNHSAGGMMNGKGMTNVDFIKSVAAFNAIRSFRFAGATTGFEQRGNQYNCVSYNWLTQANESSGTPDVNVIGNYFKEGPSNGRRAGIHNEGGRIYIGDNSDNTTTGSFGWTQMSTPFSTPYSYQFCTAQEAYDELIVNEGVGWKNTPLESAILGHIKNGTDPTPGEGVTSVSQFGGWPSVSQASTTHNYSDLEEYLASFFNATPPPSNTAPTITSIADQTIDQDQSTGALSFTVGDAESSSGSLTVSGSSSNTSLVQTNDISFGGSGSNRTVTITPDAGEFGTTDITITVSDGTDQSSTTFTLTVDEVISGNTAPTISNISDQTIDEDQSTGAISFTIDDAESSAGSLTLNSSSSNTALVQTNDISFGGGGNNRTVTVTPDAGEFGTTDITITVSDGTDQSSTTFTLTVNEVTSGNTAPTISNISDQTIDQDQSTGAISFTIDDAESSSGALTLNSSSSNTALVQTNDISFGGGGNNRTVTITPDPGEFGTTDITITVSDGTDQSSTTFTLTVNEVTSGNTAPTISNISDQTIDQDQSTGAISFTIDDAESSSGALTLNSSSSNTSLVQTADISFGGGGDNRTVTITPDPGEFGTTDITITVSDGTDQSSTTFTLTVNEVTSGNTAPTISNIPDQNIDEDQSTGAISFTIDDAESSSGALTLNSNSSNTSLVQTADISFGGGGNNRTVTITPDPGEFGATDITVTVSDGTNQRSTTFNLTVNEVTPSNTAPTISNISDQTIDEDQSTGAISFTIDDAESSSGALTLNSSSSNTSLVQTADISFGGRGSDRTVTITPDPGEFGTTNITITVSDGTDQSSTTFTLTVNEEVAGNTAPTISNIPDQTIDQDQSTGAISFTIDDGETSPGSLTLSANSSNTALIQSGDISFGGSGSDRTITVTPDPGEFGTSNITVTVSDGSSQSTNTFTVIVNEVMPINTAPTISNISDQSIDQGASLGPLTFTIDDMETDPNSLTLSATSSNSSLVENGQITLSGTGSSREISITPNSSEFGTSTITISVSDGTNTTVETFVLTVLEQTEPEITFSITVQDANCSSDDGSINLSVSGGTAPYSYSWSNGATTPNISNLASGIYSITVDDALNNRRTASFVVGNIPGVGDFEVETEISNETCNGGDGAISLLLGEGYTCVWSTGSTNENLQQLNAGTYNVTITNPEGCYIERSYTVETEELPEKPTIDVSDKILTASAGSSYEWYLNGEIVENANDQEFTPAESGDYTVAVFDANGCSATSDPVSIEIEDPVVNSNSDINELLVYPNPATTDVNIQLNTNVPIDRAVIGISNLQGAPVFRQKYGDAIGASELEETINIGTLPTGTYLVRIKINNEVIVQRLIVQ